MRKIQLLMMLLILTPIVLISCQEKMKPYDDSKDMYVLMIGETHYDMVKVFGRNVKPGEKVQIVTVAPGTLELSILDKNYKVIVGPKQVKE